MHLIVYDLLPLMRPEFFNKRTAARFRRWFRIVHNHADQAICISRQVGCDVAGRLRDSKSNYRPAVFYIKLSGDITGSSPSKGVSEEVIWLTGRMRFRPTVLMVGTIEPRKGYDVAISCFEHLWKAANPGAPELVIVGKPGWKTGALQRSMRRHPEYGRHLHWLAEVSDEGLCSLYKECRGLLITSHAEGFGLPLIEAAAHGCAILARDLPVFREHNLPNVSFFNDDRPEVLGQSVLKLASATADLRKPAPALFSWTESVDELLGALGLRSTQPAVDRPTVAARISCDGPFR